MELGGGGWECACVKVGKKEGDVGQHSRQQTRISSEQPASVKPRDFGLREA